MLVLGIDTSYDYCNICLWNEGKCLEKSEHMQRGHSQALIPMLQVLLSKANCSYREINLLTVITGPGSFTGLRVALATAKGIALAAGTPLIGVSNFEVIARATESRLYKVVLLDSLRGDLFGQIFNKNNKAVDEPFTCSLKELPTKLPRQNHVLIGNGTKLLTSNYGNIIEPTHPKANIMCTIGIAKFEQDLNNNNPQSCKPYYMRPPQAKPELWKSQSIL